MINTYKEQINYVYSKELDADLNVVSGFSGYLRAIEKEPIIQELLESVKDDIRLQNNIFERVCALSEADFDQAYANPNDTALSVMLWLLLQSNVRYALVCARYVSKAPGCWYTYRMIEKIRELENSNGSQETL